jgi:mannose-6-phosphate isomerase-like protein (cupin superfamily)
MSSMNRIPYDNLVLGKEYKIKKDDIMYIGIYYMHYRKYHDDKEPLIFIEVTPNPENKKYVEFMMSDEFYI